MKRMICTAALFTLFALPLQAQRPGCDPGNAGLILPTGFCASLIADSLPGPVRHMVVRANGDIFVGARQQGQQPVGGLYALRDADGDGRYEVREKIWEAGGTGVDMRGDYVYFGTTDAVLRFRIPQGQLRPAGAPDTLVLGLPTGGHGEKTVVLGRGDTMFVNIGSRTNACQPQDRVAGVAGADPCTELETRAGVWRFSSTRLRQRQQDGARFATGMRNMTALTLHPQTGVLYGVQHGRDNLFQNWGQHFNEVASAELPSEELFEIRAGDDFGWPYCFHDRVRGMKVLAPEYGGDGTQVGRCAGAKQPLVGYPGHWAPNDIVFYDGTQFPAATPAQPAAAGRPAVPATTGYRNGAFIAFHGSWNRAPLPQGGFNVVFQPFDAEGRPTANWTIFADGFRTVGARPTGLAVGPDGSLYISADQGRRIWRVRHVPQP